MKKRNSNFFICHYSTIFYWFSTKSYFQNQWIMSFPLTPLLGTKFKIKKKFKFLNCYNSAIFLMIPNLKTFSESVEYKLSIDTPFGHEIQNFEMTILNFFCHFLFKIFFKTPQKIQPKKLTEIGLSPSGYLSRSHDSIFM